MTPASSSVWRWLERLAQRLPGVWAGVMLAIALLVAPTAFSLLARADAGRLMGRIFALEAWWGLWLAMALVLIERRRARLAAEAGQGSRLSARLLMLLGTLFCTVAGYFALQPMMEAARAGQGTLGFGALHGISTVFYGIKALLWLALAWRAAG